MVEIYSCPTGRYVWLRWMAYRIDDHGQPRDIRYGFTRGHARRRSLRAVAQ